KCKQGNTTCSQNCLMSNKDGISEAALLNGCAAKECASDCPGAATITPCEQCLFESCSSEMNKCLADTTCSKFLQCAAKCTGPNAMSCLLSCGPTGNGIAVGQCEQKSCQSQCSQ